MESTEPIIAVGLLTQHDLDLLGSGFRRVFRLEQESCFEDLLAAIDAADRRSREDSGAAR